MKATMKCDSCLLRHSQSGLRARGATLILLYENSALYASVCLYQGMEASSLGADGKHEGAQVHRGFTQRAVFQIAAVPNLHVTRGNEVTRQHRPIIR
jgi:hypothetical protein